VVVKELACKLELNKTWSQALVQDRPSQFLERQPALLYNWNQSTSQPFGQASKTTHI